MNRFVKGAVFAAAFGVFFVFLAACEDAGGISTPVTFIRVIPNGRINETTTELVLYFDKRVEGLSPDDISLSDSKIKKGELSRPVTAGGEVAYTLRISGLSSTGSVNVTLEKPGFAFSGSPLQAYIYYVSPVVFVSVSANGNASLTSTSLILTFNREVEGLNADDISLIEPPYGMTKGELTGPVGGSGSVMYTLAISGFSLGGSVMVSVTKSGFSFEGSPKAANVFYSSVPIQFMSVIADGNSTETTKNLFLRFNLTIAGLTAGDITLSGISGIVPGTLTGPREPEYTYTLPINGFTSGGQLSVSVAKDGFAITDSVRLTTVYHTTSVTFLNVSANEVPDNPGITDYLTLSFSQPIAGLSGDDIAFTSGPSVSKGKFEGDNPYTLKIFDFTAGGNLGVSVSKAGYFVNGSPQSVAITYTPPTFETITAFRNWLNDRRPNTDASSPYVVKLTGESLSDGPSGPSVKSVLRAYSNKYVSLDLSHPSSIIREKDFENCTSLINVSIGGIGIENSAFLGCSSLTNVTIGADLYEIGSSIFSGCGSLAEIKVAEGNTAFVAENGVLYDIDKTVLYAYPAAKTGNPFIIPAGVITISGGAFSGSAGLSLVTIPNSVESIEKGAFSGSGITGVIIPNSVISIEDEVFSGCAKLTGITFGAGSTLASIGTKAFSGCTSITAINIPDSVASLGDEVFSGCSSLATLTITEAVLSIRENTLSGCGALDTLNIGKVTSIAPGALSVCGRLETITATGNLVFSVSTAAGGAGALVRGNTELFAYPAYKSGAFTVPAGILTIGNSAFKNCTRLSGINLGTAISAIGDRAFYGCTNASLTSITIPRGLAVIGENAFGGCTSLSAINVQDGEEPSVFSSEDGVLYKGSALFAYPAGKSGTFTIPPGSDIPEPVQNRAASIIVTSIEKYAFYGGIISGVVIPGTVASIGEAAFGECGRLTSVEFLGTILSANFANITDKPVFPGNLRDAFYYYESAGTPGRYTRGNGAEVWTKQ